jgi:hypothetical protein
LADKATEQIRGSCQGRVYERDETIEHRTTAGSAAKAGGASDLDRVGRTT